MGVSLNEVGRELGAAMLCNVSISKPRAVIPGFLRSDNAVVPEVGIQHTRLVIWLVSMMTSAYAWRYGRIKELLTFLYRGRIVSET